MTLKRPNKKERAQAKEILVEARALLNRPRGWVKGVLTQYEVDIKPMEIDATGIEDVHPHCAVGGLDAVSRALFIKVYGDTEGWRKTSAYQLAELRLKEAMGVDVNTSNWSIFSLNDQESTRKHHVIEWFDVAIEALS